MMRLIAFLAAILLAASAGAASTTSMNVDITVTHDGGSGVLTTSTFANYSGATLPAGTPVTMAQGFRYGDVPAGQHVVIRDPVTHVAIPAQQLDEISTWRENGGDGSYRHVVWTILLPSDLANGATAQVEFALAPGAYSQSQVLQLSALCSSGANSHDLKIHLTDLRNQDDSLRKTGDATFRVCDNIANVGRDAPILLGSGSVKSQYKVKGLFKYTDSSFDPLLYAECNVDLFVDPSTGNSLKDTKWDCWVHNPWMNVAADSAGNPGAPGPVGLTNDPQVVSYRLEADDGSTDILDWSGLDATLASSSNPVQGAVCGSDWQGTVPQCLNVPSSTGQNAWYFGQATRVISTGTPLGGLTNGALYFVYNAGSSNTSGANTNLVSLKHNPNIPGGAPANPEILTSSQGTGTTTFSTRMWHSHWQSALLRDPSGDANWSLAGGTTRTTRRIYPAATTGERTYWEQTGLVEPVVFTGNVPTMGVPWTYGCDLNYHPFGRMNVIGGTGVGARPDIGLVTEYAMAGFILQDEADWQKGQLFSLGSSSHGYSTVLNEATGRIPAMNNGPPVGAGGNGIGNSYSQLGAPFPQMYIGLGSSSQSDAGVVPPLANVPDSLNDWTGGIWAGGGTSTDHVPSFGSYTYLMWGDRAYLDMLQWHGNYDLAQITTPATSIGPSGNRDDIQGGYHFYGLSAIECCDGRGAAWTIRDRILPAALGGDSNIERSYYNDLSVETGNYYPFWLTFKDGSGSTGFSHSIAPPDGIHFNIYPADFLANYMFLAMWNECRYLHSSLCTQWGPVFQRFYDARLGEDMTGHLSSYYGIGYYFSPALHNGDAVAYNGNVGQYFNGTDASDYGSFIPFTSILAGGQLQQNPTFYTLTPGDTVKLINGAYNGNSPPTTLIDQLPGNQWFSVIGPVDNTAGTYYLQCPSGHAVDATCPIPGAAFTGFTRNGTAIQETGEVLVYRPSYAPPTGFEDGTYCSYTGEALHGLTMLGYDMTNAMKNFVARSGGDNATGNCYNTTSEPSQWWDISIQIP